MKTEGSFLPTKERTAPLYLESSAHRWKWMAGSSAAIGAAATTGAMAGRVQITQSDSLISSVTPGAIKGDLTGDTNSDFSSLFSSGTLSGTRNSVHSGYYYYQFRHRAIAWGFDKFFNYVGLGFAGYVKGFTSTTTSSSVTNTFTFTSAYAGRNYNGGIFNYESGATPNDARGFSRIVFSDTAINGGAATSGFIEVRATSSSLTNHTVQLLRLVFDDATTAAPTGAVLGGTDPEFDPAVYAQRAAAAAAAAQAAAAKAAQISQLNRSIKKLKAKAKKAKKSGNAKKAKKFKAKIKKLQKQLNAL